LERGEGTKIRMKYGTVAVLIVLMLFLSISTTRLSRVKADSGTLTVPEEYPTITAAIAAASPGDTIMVGPGTYNEEVVIDKAVKVLGSGAGSTFINGTGVVLASAGLVKITAPGDVTFDGFTVENAPLDPSLNRFGIFSESGASSVTYTISNNEIIGTGDTNPDDFEVGFYSQNDQANVVFNYNNITNMGGNNIVFEVHTGTTEISYNNLEAGVGLAADSVFFMTYSGNDVNALQNISYNTFNMGTGSVFDYDHRSSAISICTPGAAYGVGDAQFTNVVIQGNYIYNLQSYRRGIGFWNGGGSGGSIIGPSVEDNTVTGTGATESYGIDFEATGSSPIAATNATVMDNTISNTADGIYLRTDGCAPGAQIYFNNIVGNTVGLNNTIGSSAVDARYNWWGDPTGPYNPTSNPSGQGNPVTGNVTYQPYQTSPVPTVYTLTVAVSPVGSGSVTLNDTGPYYYGDVVQLTAVPSAGWSFSGWSEALSGCVNPATLTITGNMSVTATFVQINYTLTVSVVGHGSVTLNNTGPNYHYGDVVRLTASPSLGWSFLNWSGNLIGSTNLGMLVILGNMSVTATFTGQDQYILTVNTVGSGSVSESPNQATYAYGTIVTLTASASVGWSFAGWSGSALGNANPTNVNMTGNETVTATFTQNVYTLALFNAGNGAISLNKTGPYHYGDSVLLWALPSSGWIFQYWSGDLSGSVNPATMVMTGNFSITANFIPKPTLQMSPASRTCRVYGENFTVAIMVSNAASVVGFTFEIHYNATLLAYEGVTWNFWGSGTISDDSTIGNITGFTGGAATSGATLITLTFQACFHHMWKSAANWTNDLTDTIYLQWANMSYTVGPDLCYQRGGLGQINVGPDFAYTFSPIQGDVTNSGVVNILDLRTVAAYFGVSQGDPLWPAASTYDLNGDGTINVLDLRIVASNYGYTYTP
jgi:uncharacterized repeat protein (TIGR02543 family)